MKRGKYEYELDQMIELQQDNIAQFIPLFLEKQAIQPAYLDPLAEDVWDSHLRFEGLEPWLQFFTSSDLQDQHVLIVGDYDVDGIMASKVALFLCEACGVEVVDVYIPNRFTDGYGLNKTIVQKAIDDEYTVILTVDNGISAFDAIAYAQASGVKVLLTDHHHIKDQLPDATLILHPDLGEVNQGVNICGTAVIYALARALLGEKSKSLIPYVMLATLADSMPLYMLNRAFVQVGLRQWNTLNDPFLDKLCQRLEVDTSDSTSFAWKLIPVLNAIGRMADVNDFADVLFWQQSDMNQMIDEMINLNELRKKETEKIVNDVMQQDNNGAIICAADATWHQGVLGIAAARLVEAFQKPVLLFAQMDMVYKGSGRSPEYFQLFDFLQANEQHLHAFGGHAQACGLTVMGEQYELIQRACTMYPEISIPRKKIDFDITDLDTKALAFLSKELKKLAPFGNGLPTPLFHLCTINQQIRLLGKNREHVKFTLPNQMQLLFFNEQEQWRLTEQANVHVVGPLSTNYWQETMTYQSIVNDWWIDGVEFFYPNQVTNEQLDDEVVIIDTIPASVSAFEQLKQTVIAKGMCLLQWQEAQKRIVKMDEAQLRMLYKYFLQKSEVRIDDSMYQIMKSHGIEKNGVNFAIKVFLELEFVIIEDGILKIQKKATKRQLSDSSIYQKMRFQNRFVEQVVYASPQKRKELFEHLEE